MAFEQLSTIGDVIIPGTNQYRQTEYCIFLLLFALKIDLFDEDNFPHDYYYYEFGGYFHFYPFCWERLPASLQIPSNQMLIAVSLTGMEVHLNNWGSNLI